MGNSKSRLKERSEVWDVKEFMCKLWDLSPQLFEFEGESYLVTCRNRLMSFNYGSLIIHYEYINRDDGYFDYGFYSSSDDTNVFDVNELFYLRPRKYKCRNIMGVFHTERDQAFIISQAHLSRWWPFFQHENGFFSK